jgi:hypothetical protein
MDFTVEFHETEVGKCPVREFLDQLKASDPDDFATVIAGLPKLRNRQYPAPQTRDESGKGDFTTETQSRGFFTVSPPCPRRLGR